MKRFIGVWIILVWMISHSTAQPVQDDSYELYLTQIAAAEAFLQLNKISTAKHYLNACAERYRDLEWYFLASFLDQSKEVVRKDNATPFTDLKISPNEKIIAVAGADSLITLYSYPHLEKIRDLKAHTGSVSSVAFSSDGKWLASGGRDHRVVVWNVEAGQPLWQNDSSFSRGIYQVRFSPDDQTIAVVSWELLNQKVSGFAKLLDARSGAELKKIVTEPHPAAAVVFTNKGNNLVVACWGEIVFAYDITTGKEIWKYDLSGPEEYNAFHSIDLSPDGEKILLGSADHRVHLLHASTGQLLHRIEPWQGHTNIIKAVQYTPNGELFATAGLDQTIFVWDAGDFSLQQVLIGHEKTVTGLCWAEDGHTLLSVAQDGTLRTWNLNSPFEVNYEVCNYGPWQAPLTSDGKYFAAPCSDKDLSIYEISSGKKFRPLKEQSGLCADFSADNKHLVTSSFDGVVRLWDVDKGVEKRSFKGHTSRVDGIAYMNSTGYILSVGDSTLRVWELSSDEAIRSILLPKPPFRIVLGKNEKKAYIGCRDGTILTYDTGSWNHTASYKAANGLQEISASPDGKMLAVYSGSSIEIWETDTGKRKYELNGHGQSGYAIGFSPDSRYLVSGSYDQTFKLWNLATGSCTLTFHGYQETVYTTKFTSEREILVGSSKGNMRFYNFKR